MGTLAARKKRRARSRSPRSRQSRSATAWAAATVIPCPYVGLNEQIASPATSSPAGKLRRRS